CFTGCGFLGFYHVGATRCLSERAPHLLRGARTFFGASGGALHCALLLTGIPLDQILQSTTDFVRYTRRRNIGVFHPSFNLFRYLQEFLQRNLPDNAHELISGRLCISLTRVSDLESVLVSDFKSKDEVVDALLCSSFIPYFSGLTPPSFRGVRYMDGSLSNSLPSFDGKTTITVCPFYGEFDICPKLKSTNFLHLDIAKLNLRFCLGNVYLISHILFPPDVKVAGEICLRGYLDAVRFLEEKGICDRPHPGLSLSSGEPEFFAFSWENKSPEASPGVAAWQRRPEENELLDHLRLNFLPWDESILEALSPTFLAVLNEVVKSRGGCMSRIRTSLPVSAMSYVLLPCTLPAESALAMARRLVLWLPDIPDDIQWLYSITSQACSRVMTRLFSTFSGGIAPLTPLLFPMALPGQVASTGSFLDPVDQTLLGSPSFLWDPGL
ncbi:PREDICTED: patatin-like phospholipase domain-containing protein 3, partial [Miniopterus natalensis]|uniref:patatin-like phospholipase domain-containing protein 3 n=1 Tax=Miniopterus natalensis TaxID=291302 RepID=UPI0007A6CE19